MTTDHPYSQQWRERTTARMEALGVTDHDVEVAIGIDPADVLDVGGPISLEVAGPFDELLARLEDDRENEALQECVVHHPGQGSPRVRRVRVDLGPLADCDIEFTDTPSALRPSEPWQRAVARDGAPKEPDNGVGDELREWRSRK